MTELVSDELVRLDVAVTVVAYASVGACAYCVNPGLLVYSDPLPLVIESMLSSVSELPEIDPAPFPEYTPEVEYPSCVGLACDVSSTDVCTGVSIIEVCTGEGV